MPKEISNMRPLAVIGDEDAIMGFGALGFNVYPVKDSENYPLVFEEAMKEGVAICLIQENVYRALMPQINAYRNFALPIFIPFAQLETRWIKEKDKKSLAGFAQTAKLDLLDEIIKGVKLRATGVL
jgi:vacuolar-type H+-ATPase subunit F/Vma7